MKKGTVIHDCECTRPETMKKRCPQITQIFFVKTYSRYNW